MAFNFSDLLSNDSALGKLANTYVSGLANNANKPKPLVIQEPAPAVMTQSASSFDSKKYLLIGSGVLGLILLVVLVGRRK